MEKEINIPEQNCINCEHFAWWDGDYCCVAKKKILQESPEGEFNEDILMSLKLNKDCEAWSRIEEERNIYEEPFKNWLKNK